LRTFLKQSVRISRQYFHQQTIVAAFIVEAFIGKIGVHAAKVKKTVELTECSPEREAVLSAVEGRRRESSAVEIPGKFYYFST
jgi:hypothetical protein